MADLLVRNIPDKVYKQAQTIAAAHGITLSAYILELLEADIAAHEARRRLRCIMAKLQKRPYYAPAPDNPSTSDIIFELRGERESQLPFSAPRPARALMCATSGMC